jgi:hypothetical protein
LSEILGKLTPAERVYFQRSLLGESPVEGDADTSAQAARQMKHRILLKVLEYLQ